MSAIAACPACVGLPDEVLQTAAKGAAARAQSEIVLSLPEIHCAACISGVERLLRVQTGVVAARVNLTLKRATVQIDGSTDAQTLATVLTRSGFAAAELDPATIAATTADAAGRNLLLRMAVAGFGMMNVMLLSVAIWSGAADATRDLFHWISAAISVPAVGFAAQPFFSNALRALGGRRVNMDVPISLAILLALGMSVYEVSHGGQHAYFDAALSLTFFLLIGRYLDHRARAAARSAADELAALEPARAMRVTANGPQATPLADLEVGDHIHVVPGTRVPVDGRVVEGCSDMDRALLTGETMPVTIAAGDPVHAGEVTLTGPLVIELTERAQDSTLQKLRALVEVAENARSRYTSLADRAAGLYVPMVHTLALAGFVGWLVATGDLRVALNIAVAVLIITCPCALALAIPAVSTVATGKLFRLGVLVKSPTALERLCEVDRVVFDKTGTLTKGQPVWRNRSDIAAGDLAVIAALAQGSAHPLSRALADALSDVPAAKLTGITENPGCGITGQWQGKTVRLGRADWIGATPLAMLSTWFDKGDGAPVALTFVDQLRPNAAQAVQALDLPVCMLSGDTEANAQAVAQDVGITDIRAGIGPQDKARAVEQMGGKVLMMGDGLNDTAALGAAHVSISPAAAVDASRAVSDVVLLQDDLMRLTQTIDIARQAKARMRQNLGIAVVYNMIAVPLALLGFVTPLLAALAMSGSSIVVSLNALRIKG